MLCSFTAVCQLCFGRGCIKDFPNPIKKRKKLKLK